jgi:hypothetical protein
MNKYFYISREKEFYDNNSLIEKIREDKFVTADTVLVNVMPDYSSLLCQYANHKFSIFNNYELLPQISLEIPYPTMSQIVDRDTEEVENFERYLPLWVHKHIVRGYKYLFMTSDISGGKEFLRINSYMKSKLDPENYSYAATYVEDSSQFNPEFFTERYDARTKGNILYQWENAFNPNWNY